ncbi:AraC family transcriptional regulator [Salmonella enterica subsp. enterica serovar Choleraesuis]|nr:AraC family transcriptional regulator [Salmonella enterica subsp. enterica serovar Choleraesuis]
MSTLDYLLEHLKLQSSIFSQLTLNGHWGITKARHPQGAPFHLLLSGDAWLRLPGQQRLIHLNEGDMVMIPAGHQHDLLSEPNARTVAFTQLLASNGYITSGENSHFQVSRITVGLPGERQTKLVTGIFNFGESLRNPLVTTLPDYLHLRGERNPWLPSSLALLSSELDSEQPGMSTIAVRMADILFVQAIRHYLSQHHNFTPGWLNGLNDPQIAKSLALIHQNPAHPWNLVLLSQTIGMSRSRFAERFKTLIGQTPMSYLTEWRMYLAADRLRHSQIRLTQLAAESGYESDVAFSKAFKKWSGYTPRAFRAGESSSIDPGSDTVSPE